MTELDIFHKMVTIKCKNEHCTNTVTTRLSLASRRCGVYCEPCRIEAQRQNDRNYYNRHKHSETFLEHRRHRQRVSYWQKQLEN